MSEALITESEPLTFTLPDGSLKLVRKGTTLQNVAESIDSSVAKNAVYAEIDGQYIDLIEAVQKSGTLNIITLFDEEALDPCTLEQLEGECKSILHLVLDIYKQFGFEEVEIKLSTRPEKRMGSDTDWDRLENALSASLEAQGLQWSVNPGEGAFYGPKLEFVLRDAIGRDWQCGTLQVDMNLPDRFDIGYIAEDGSTKRPVMLHRALFGSLERFTGILLEHYAGKLPAWLSPVQAVVMTITDKQHRYAEQVLKALRRKGLRCETDLRNYYSTKQLTALRCVADRRRCALINQHGGSSSLRENRCHIWPVKKDDTQSNDIAFFEKAFREQSSRWGLYEIVLGCPGEGNISLYQSVNQGADVPHILIAAGFHGEEPAGCWGMLDFLREGSPELFDNVAVSFLPLVNLSGLSAGCRLNSTGQNPNRGFTNGAEVEPSVEGKVLLNYEALLLRQQAYLYTFEHTARPGHFSVALRDELERFFPVMEKERVDGCECEDGIIFNHFDSSFESWLYSSGSDVAACTETPGLQPFAKRAEANRYLIGAFISSILERNSIGGGMS
ncbi:TPA: aminoacyl--tRNA ligase-related protein [Klebsiella pneumoniae]